MATSIIDSLLVTLGLDPRGFKKGADEATKTQKTLQRQVEQSSEGMVEALRDVRRETIAMFAGFEGATGFLHLLARLNDAAVKVGLLAKNTHVATQELSAWQNITEDAGGGLEDISGAFSMLSKEATSFQVTGQSGIIGYLRQLNVGLLDPVTGKTRDLSQILLELSDRFSGLDRPTANNIGQAMGFNQGTMNLLLQGRKAVEEQLREQKQYNLVSERSAENALKLRVAFSTLRQEVQSLWRGFLDALTPGLLRVFAGLSKVGQWFREHKTLVVSFFAATAAVIVTAFLPAIISATVAVAAFIAEIALILLPIAAGIAALALLIEDWWVWLHGGKSALGEFWQFWADGWAKATEIIGHLRDFLVAIFHGDVRGAYAAGMKLGESLATGIRDGLKKYGKDILSFLLQGPAMDFGKWLGGKMDGFMKPDAAADNRPVGIRNNNPLNLKFANQPGATQGEGGFARFSTVEEGIANANRQLDLYAKRGINTIGGIVRTAAPASDKNNVPAYIQHLMDSTGRRENDTLQPGDREALINAMFAHEQGSLYAPAHGLVRGVLGGMPGALAAGQGAGASAAVAATGSSSSSQQSHSEVNIGSITVETQATDAEGIAGSIGTSTRRIMTAAQADTGITS